MPKIISRSQAFLSNHEDEKQMTVYYCVGCGKHALICEDPVDSAPTRKTDGALILEKTASTKFTATEGAGKVLKRGEAYERQNRYFCDNCGLLVYYTCTTAPGLAYVMDGAIRAENGHVPGQSNSASADLGKGGGDVDAEIQALIAATTSGGAEAGAGAGAGAAVGVEVEHEAEGEGEGPAKRPKLKA